MIEPLAQRAADTHAAAERLRADSRTSDAPTVALRDRDARWTPPGVQADLAEETAGHALDDLAEAVGDREEAVRLRRERLPEWLR
jgi:hypothetical protein